MNFRNLFENPILTPWQRYYCVAGTICFISTDSELILAAAGDSFTPIAEAPSAVDISMCLSVDRAAQSRPPWPQPHFRGLSHLVFAAFDSENAVLVDLRQRRAIGRFSPAMAADREYLRRVIFPALFGTFTYVISVTPLHCACVERDGRGLLLAGASGSGKSTLSLALARSGFGFLSDDWTYFSWREGRLLAWGLPTPLKLLPDAREHFPELADIQPGLSLNGELAYEIEPDQVFGVRRSACAEPGRLIFLERQTTPGFSVSGVSHAEATAQFEKNPDDLPDSAGDLLMKTIRVLAQRSCWLLRYGGDPSTVAQGISDFLDRLDADAPSRWAQGLHAG